MQKHSDFDLKTSNQTHINSDFLVFKFWCTPTIALLLCPLFILFLLKNEGENADKDGVEKSSP